MIDSLQNNQKFSRTPQNSFEVAGVDATLLRGAQVFCIVTMHLADPAVLKLILRVLREISKLSPLVFELYPSTKANIKSFGLSNQINARRLIIWPPQSSLDFLT